MNLDTCWCGQIITTKNAVRVLRQSEPILSKKILYFNCPNCDTSRFKKRNILFSYQGYYGNKLLDLPKEIRAKAWSLKLGQRLYYSIGNKNYIIRRSS